MDDLIRRQDAIDAIIKKLCIKDESYLLPSEEEIVDTIKEMPSSQLEKSEVIRCKDCKNWKPKVEVENRGLGTCSFHNAKYVTSEGYCYWAERREDVRKPD